MRKLLLLLAVAIVATANAQDNKSVKIIENFLNLWYHIYVKFCQFYYYNMNICKYIVVKYGEN